jgi:hypothetical protein
MVSIPRGGWSACVEGKEKECAAMTLLETLPDVQATTILEQIKAYFTTSNHKLKSTNVTLRRWMESHGYDSLLFSMVTLTACTRNECNGRVFEQL